MSNDPDFKYEECWYNEHHGKSMWIVQHNYKAVYPGYQWWKTMMVEFGVWTRTEKQARKAARRFLNNLMREMNYRRVGRIKLKIDPQRE